LLTSSKDRATRLRRSVAEQRRGARHATVRPPPQRAREPERKGKEAQAMAASSEQNPEYDLLITGGTVIDPGSGRNGPADVAIAAGKITAVGQRLPGRARRTLDATGLLVTPGLIDLHAHVYAGCTPLSIDPDPLAARSGTTTMVDCGSAGAATFAGYRRFIVEPARCRLLAFVNISLIGLAAMPECGYGRFVDSNAALRCIEEHRDLVVGVKVRASRNAFGEDNTAQPVWMAVAAAGA